jgi:hypothetical protein
MSTWAGVIPLRLVADQPVADPRLPAGISVPSYAVAYKRG